MEAVNSSVVAHSSQQGGDSIPAHKITAAFERARREGRGALIPYFMCGYPTAAQSIEIILAAAESGADIIELGMPFSDPLADGATIQHAGHIALEHGMTIKGCMEVARQVSARSDVALLLMGYYNPVMAYGIERFCAAARASGVSSLIIPDLPPEEADPLQEAAYRHGLSLVFLIPPTTPDARIADVARRTVAGPGGFIYCVSLSGVTGSRNELSPHLRSFIERVRRYTSDKQIPLAVGFGLSKPEHIAAVTSLVEGAAVGSALVNLIDQHKEDEQVEAVKAYIRSLAGK
ncbi:MAG: tryptophan synthase subunit alpha [Ktedonobacteraceae bacterium]